MQTLIERIEAAVEVEWEILRQLAKQGNFGEAHSTTYLRVKAMEAALKARNTDNA